MEVALGFFARNFFDTTAEADLPIELDPVKQTSGVRIRLQLLALFALVIGEKNETVAIESFAQNNSDRRFSVTASSGEAHRVHITNPGFDRSGEPVGELFDRIGIEIAAAQADGGMLVMRCSRIARRFPQEPPEIPLSAIVDLA